MDVEGSHDRPAGAPPLPRSIWVVAWGSVVGQLVLLADRGAALDSWPGVLLSTGFGAVIVGYVSAGVVRARPVRFALACVVLVLSAIGELVSLLAAPGLGVLDALGLLTSVTVLGGLVMFRGTAWYVWQRTRPPSGVGASVGGLVAVAVVVGVLGGVAAPQDDGLGARVGGTAR